MIDLTRINAQQAERNRRFLAWLDALDVAFTEEGHDPKIEPYYPDENADFDVTPVQAHITDPAAGPGTFGATYRLAQRWKDLKAAAKLIRWRISVT